MQVDPSHRVGKVSLQSRDGHRRGQRRFGQPFQRLDAAEEFAEQLVGAGCLDDQAAAKAEQPLRLLAHTAAAVPVQRVAPRGSPLERGYQRGVPFGRPPLDEQAVLVEDLVEQLVPFLRVGFQFVGVFRLPRSR